MPRRRDRDHEHAKEIRRQAKEELLQELGILQEQWPICRKAMNEIIDDPCRLQRSRDHASQCLQQRRLAATFVGARDAPRPGSLSLSSGEARRRERSPSTRPSSTEVRIPKRFASS